MSGIMAAVLRSFVGHGYVPWLRTVAEAAFKQVTHIGPVLVQHYWACVGTTLGQRLRRWPNVVPTQDRGLWHQTSE